MFIPQVISRGAREIQYWWEFTQQPNTVRLASGIQLHRNSHTLSDSKSHTILMEGRNRAGSRRLQQAKISHNVRLIWLLVAQVGH